LVIKIRMNIGDAIRLGITYIYASTNTLTFPLLF